MSIHETSVLKNLRNHKLLGRYLHDSFAKTDRNFWVLNAAMEGRREIFFEIEINGGVTIKYVGMDYFQKLVLGEVYLVDPDIGGDSSRPLREKIISALIDFFNINVSIIEKGNNRKGNVIKGSNVIKKELSKILKEIDDDEEYVSFSLVNNSKAFYNYNINKATLESIGATVSTRDCLTAQRTDDFIICGDSSENSSIIRIGDICKWRTWINKNNFNISSFFEFSDINSIMIVERKKNNSLNLSYARVGDEKYNIELFKKIHNTLDCVSIMSNPLFFNDIERAILSAKITSQNNFLEQLVDQIRWGSRDNDFLMTDPKSSINTQS